MSIPNCENGTPWFASHSGWDEVSGLGSPNLYNLARDWLAAPYVSESFATNRTDPRWVIGGSAFTTAGNQTTDATVPSGQGWLQLTGHSASDRDSVGYAYYNRPLVFSPGESAKIEFDYACWGGGVYNPPYYGQGADGLTVFVRDATTQHAFRPGGIGGALGYIGMPDGYLGLGFNEYVNFASTPNTVALRGAAPDYKLLTSSAPNALTICDVNARSRPSPGHPGYIHIIITLGMRGNLSVSTDDGTTVIRDYDITQAALPTPPRAVYIGVAASTGLGTDTHEIRNFSLAFTRPRIQRARFDPSRGGQLAGVMEGQEFTLTVPPNAFSTTTVVTAAAPFDTPAAPAGSVIIGSPIDFLAADDFGNPVTQFNVPLTLSFGYPASLSDTDAARLYLAYYDTSVSTWTPLNISTTRVDLIAHTLSAQTSHFTQFALILPESNVPTPGPQATPEAPGPQATPEAPGPQATPEAPSAVLLGCGGALICIIAARRRRGARKRQW